MSVPTTMFRLTGRDYPPAKLSQASLIIIDAQKEYLSGPLALSGMDEAVANIARLLDAARKAGRPIIHVRHLGTVGGRFDPQGPAGEFIPGLEPRDGEIIIEKRMPNAFKNTKLHETLQELGHLDLIVCGFMSHSSVSTTVRRAKDYGYRCTLVEDASATRDLALKDQVIPAAQIHACEMAVMADNFACVAPTAGLSALLATLGVLLAMAGVAGLLGNYPALAELNANRALSGTLTVAGLLLLYLGVRFWRRSRIRLRRGRELNLSPHLMKKHD